MKLAIRGGLFVRRCRGALVFWYYYCGSVSNSLIAQILTAMESRQDTATTDITKKRNEETTGDWRLAGYTVDEIILLNDY